jgi:hypothetical protein
MCARSDDRHALFVCEVLYSVQCRALFSSAAREQVLNCVEQQQRLVRVNLRYDHQAGHVLDDGGAVRRRLVVEPQPVILKRHFVDSMFNEEGRFCARLYLFDRLPSSGSGGNTTNRPSNGIALRSMLNPIPSLCWKAAPILVQRLPSIMRGRGDGKTLGCRLSGKKVLAGR